jgi:tRNA A-37 threonylcarbamoyl transferase component Bud32
VVVYRPRVAPRGGHAAVDPAFAARFAALGIDSAAGFLDLPGEVVGGHPDRHVVRVELPGFPAAFYLKRQHAVTWRERLRNRLAGFGWVSRCEREACILKQLAAANLPCPRCVACGDDGRGRAFLLVEELPDTIDLRRVLGDSALSPADRRQLADRLGRVIALLHAGGFTTPDLTAKHVLVAPDSGDVTVIDWQSSRRVRSVTLADRLAGLAALHASVAEPLAGVRERLRVLRAALRPALRAGLVRDRFSDLARRVAAESEYFRGRRSIRDQRYSIVTATGQRLVWVAGEAVCAVPNVAATWPTTPLCYPYYGGEPGTSAIRLPDGREAHLIRGRSFAPLGRLRAWLRGRPWRSPGVTLGRVLFHLERYGISAPRLFAFGQRFTGPASAEWFALHSPPAQLAAYPDAATAEQLGRCLRRLHDAGCRVTGYPLAVFGVDAGGVSVRDVAGIALSRRITDSAREHDLDRLLAAIPVPSRPSAEAGYRNGKNSDNEHTARLPTLVSRPLPAVDVNP